MSTITINQDKTISINGKKIFPFGIYSITRYGLESLESDDISLLKNRDFTYSAGGNYWTQSTDFVQKYENNGIKFCLKDDAVSTVPQWIIDSPEFFGFQNFDEPQPNTTLNSVCYNLTLEECHAKILNKYNQFKSRCSSCFVIQNHWHDVLDIWQDCGDILTYDIYPVQKDETYWVRADAMYAYEHYTNANILKGRKIDNLSKPLWAVTQAYGKDYNQWLKCTPQEIRCFVYIALTMNVKGIILYGYKSWGGATDTSGLMNDTVLHNYVVQIAKEIRLLNEILVTPTTEYSWEYDKGTSVTFSKNISKTVLWSTRTNWNYIIKQLNNTKYLIIVNKDSTSISNVEITVSGLNNTTVTTIGLQTTGSGKAGRNLTVTNGKFTDSFDGYAVHIYQIGMCPASQCNFTITQ